MKINKRTLVFSIVLLFSIFACSIVDNETYWLNWLGVIVYLFAICTWHWEKKDKIFSLYTIFITFFLLFNYGQCIMWALGIGNDRGYIAGELLVYNSGLVVNDPDLVSAKWYICISMLVFHLGSLILSNRKHPVGVTRNLKNTCDIDRLALLRVGQIVTLITTPIAFFQSITEMIISLRFGYSALYYGDTATQGGYVQIIMFMFFPGLICLLIGSNFAKRETRIVTVIFTLYAVLGTAAGNRGTWLYSLVVLIWVLQQNKGGFNRGTIIKISIIGIIALYILSVIKSSRDLGGLANLSLDSFVTAFNAENSPIVDAFFEMGGTMSILLIFIKSGVIYPYANTYLTAILGALSTRMLSLFGLKFVLLGDWISQECFNLNYGLGFSMIAEAYINGGQIGGLFYMFVLGIIIGKLLCMCRDNKDIKNYPQKSFISIATANILMGFPRSAAYLIVKNFVYGVLFILLLMYIVKEIYKHRMAK